ncbi:MULTISPECIES: energy transducer TonB [unclassified Bradyrhizobium]|uniref:energy transducer TonB n=1 Tax=unclassified Bradyrhizobium TaxID=2631580 RepID=UPI001BAA63E6|nr:MULTISPECIES: TonB family protein [unclassified Bradyrhizobium]MBR1226295.1 energy transducer TonB [Bradyrhizobium sp. AUGA SZCCT0176]MBR1295293.1 energy transducer TonB [Bradyrhizobium sp. AUGA SZCCT0042]
MMQLAAEDRSDLQRWMLSGLAVLCVYAGATATLATWRYPDDTAATEPSGAIVVDLAPLPAAPATTPSDVAPGPEQVMSEAQPVAKPEVTPPDETPELPPAPNPDAAVALQSKLQPEVTPQQQAAAATTSAPAAVPDRIAPVAVAPTQGAPSAKDSEAVVTWRTKVLALIEKNKRYPEAARPRQGTARVSFALDRKGMVANARVIESSGSSALDEEAVALLKRAEPFPTPPATFPGDSVVVRLPIRFTVK